MFNKDTIKYLDSLKDDEFILFLNIKFGATLPQWERCTKEEWEKFEEMYLKGKISLEYIESALKFFREYRRVPFWNNGGGILDQISVREPDGYYYEKCVGYKKCLMLGSDMMEYCEKRFKGKINMKANELMIGNCWHE